MTLTEMPDRTDIETLNVVAAMALLGMGLGMFLYMWMDALD